MRKILFACLAALAAACSQPAQDHAPASAGAIAVTEAWAAPTPGGVNVSAGYFTISNTGAADDALVGATAPRAGRVEVHEMAADGAVMRMRQIERLVIPAGGSAALAPGGAHLMFYDIDQPFTADEEIAVTLTFEHAGAVDVILPVRRGAASHSGH